MSDPTMTAPTTGADELRDTYTLTITREQLPLLNDALFCGVVDAENYEDHEAMKVFRDELKHQLHNQPAAAVPDAETIEAIREIVRCYDEGITDVYHEMLSLRRYLSRHLAGDAARTEEGG